MKKYLALLVIAFFTLSCEGPVGPPGPPGPPGDSGLIGLAFERVVDFTPSNNYSVLLNFPDELVVYESDIVMVYMLWEETNAWQPLPISVYFQDDLELQFAFDFTVADVSLFLTGNVPLNEIGPDLTQNKLFRIVVLPATSVENNNVNLKNAKAVMDLIDQSKIKLYKANQLEK